MSYTDEQKSILTDEERAALADDDSEVTEETGDEQVEDQSAKPAEADKDAEPAKADDTVKVEPVKAEPGEKQEATFTPQYQAKAVEDYDKKMADFATQKTELRQKLKDGDLDIEEYEQQKDVVAAAEASLREEQFKVKFAAEQREQVLAQRWEWEQEQFFGDEKNAVYKDSKLLDRLNVAVKVIATDPVNAGKSGVWVLQEADRITRAMAGIDVKKPDAEPNEKKENARKPDLSVVPKTLAHLPAAEIAQMGDVGEFDHIDRLEGLEYERAVGALTTAQRDRYLAA